MINYDEKFIFVHIYKTGGGSVRSMLRRSQKNTFTYHFNMSTNKFRTALGRPRLHLKGQLDEHARAVEYKEYLHEDFNSFFKFAIIRNPYTWHMSPYSFARSRFYHPERKILKSLNFSEYLEWRSLNPVTQHSFLYEGDECLVNKIYRFEDIVSGDSTIFNDLGLAGSKLTKKKNSSPRHPNLTEKDKELIYKLNREDFRLLNYNR
jgi:hypothetical protein